MKKITLRYLGNTNNISTELEQILKITNKDDDGGAEKNIISKINDLSTGRLAKWIFITMHNENYYFGQGPNRDRIFFSSKISEILSSESISLIGNLRCCFRNFL